MFFDIWVSRSMKKMKKQTLDDKSKRNKHTKVPRPLYSPLLKNIFRPNFIIFAQNISHYFETFLSSFSKMRQLLDLRMKANPTKQYTKNPGNTSRSQMYSQITGNRKNQNSNAIHTSEIFGVQTTSPLHTYFDKSYKKNFTSHVRFSYSCTTQRG